MTSRCNQCDSELTDWARNNCEGTCCSCYGSIPVTEDVPLDPDTEGYVPKVDPHMEGEDWDFPEGTTCNPDAPEECESCQ